MPEEQLLYILNESVEVFFLFSAFPVEWQQF